MFSVRFVTCEEIFFSAFPKNTAISVVNILIDILFIADIVLNFRTGYIDEAKKLADELADHDLIWLCDKHTRARASLEC